MLEDDGCGLRSSPDDLSSVALRPEPLDSCGLRSSPDDLMLDVRYGERLYLVVDPLKDNPLDEFGSPLDQVRMHFRVEYKEVCHVGQACQELDEKDRLHRGPTGDLDYVFDYPEDFGKSELPRMAYWQLIPPIRARLLCSRN